MNKSFVFDTNTPISAFLFWNSVPKAAYNKAVKLGSLMASVETHTEFKTVFCRAKFEKYISNEDRFRVLRELEDIMDFSTIEERITECRDPKDNKFLELAVAARASCIVTGDKDLLILHPFREIPILNPSDFLDIF